MLKQLIFSSAVLATSFAIAIPYLSQQQAVPAKQVKVEPDGHAKLVQKVGQLERRVLQLESVLFSTAKLSVMRAEKRLAESKERLSHSSKLFKKGFVTRAQMNQDEFDVKQAEQELKLAQTERGQRRIVSDLEILDARQRLKNAEEQLLYVQRLSERQYSTQTDVENAKRAVDIARRALDNAEMKMKAVEELDSIKSK